MGKTFDPLDILKMPMAEMMEWLDKNGNITEAGLVYKYRPLFDQQGKIFPFTEKFLVDSQIFFADPVSFNDPFDTETVRAFPYKLSELVDEILQHSNVQSEDRDELIKIFRKFQQERPPEYFNDDVGSGWAAGFLKVFCASLQYDIPSMWAQYANNHTGICVGIKTYELLEDRLIKLDPSSLETKSPSECLHLHPILRATLTVMQNFGLTCPSLVDDEYVGISNVGYSNGTWEFSSYEAGHPLLFSEERLLQKAECWSPEKETRAILSFFDTHNGVCSLVEGEIAEIIFGVRITETEISSFFKHLSKSIPLFSEIKFYRMKKKIGIFELERVPVKISDYL